MTTFSNELAPLYISQRIHKNRRLRDKITFSRIGANLRTASIRNCQKAGFTEPVVYSFEFTPISFFTGVVVQ